ncbi:MAG: hypothetical protein ABI456_14425 [Ktedonobacteraceae bacterium]
MAQLLPNTPSTFPNADVRPPANADPSLPPYTVPVEPLSPKEFDEQQSVVTLHNLLRQTGLGIKVQFLLALTLIAVFPAVLLVLLLGDPSGQEQRASLGQGLQLQAQTQATALDHMLAARQRTISTLARNPMLLQVATGTANPGTVQSILQTVQQADDASVMWFLVRTDGTILAAGDGPGHLRGLRLPQTQIVSQTSPLLQLIQTTVAGKSPTPLLLLSDDARISGGWLAIASSLTQRSSFSKAAAIVGVFSLQKVAQGLNDTSNFINGLVGVLLDSRNRVVAHTGHLSVGQKAFASAPRSVQAVPLGTAAPTIVDNDPLTGQTDIAIGAAIPTLNGRYLLLVPQNTSLVPSNRVFFAGRNTPLLILGILVVVILVATWVALPIVRPIRRATREIGSTTQEVRKLANDARRIAQDHSLGIALLNGANRKLLSRRQSIIRDEYLIRHICTALWPRLQCVQPIVQSSGNTQAMDVFQIVQQGIAQINNLATATATSLEKDTSLSQLDSAMESAREISTQFEDAGKQLEQGAEQLETAARTLL